jgi:hypothetical protein
MMADRAQMRLNVSLPRENTFKTGGSVKVALSYRQRKKSQVDSRGVVDPDFETIS